MKSYEMKNTSPNKDKTGRQNWRKNVTCHNYGSKGQLKRECKKSESVLSKGRVQEKQGSCANVLTKGNCVVDGYIGSTELKCCEKVSATLLVDTGVSLTILSKRIYDSFSEKTLPGSHSIANHRCKW